MEAGRGPRRRLHVRRQAQRSHPTSTLAFATLFAEAGFPPGVINVVTGWGPETGAALASHPGVDKIAFTGSTATGIEVGKAAIANMTRFTLELGGKSAQVVFDDADLDAAANGVIAGVFAATGQTCLAGSRLLVHERVADALTDKIAARAATIKLGDPKDPTTEMGPVSNASQYERYCRTSHPPASRALPLPAAANPTTSSADTSSSQRC